MRPPADRCEPRRPRIEGRAVGVGRGVASRATRYLFGPGAAPRCSTTAARAAQRRSGAPRPKQEQETRVKYSRVHHLEHGAAQHGHRVRFMAGISSLRIMGTLRAIARPPQIWTPVTRQKHYRTSLMLCFYGGAQGGIAVFFVRAPQWGGVMVMVPAAGRGGAGIRT